MQSNLEQKNIPKGWQRARLGDVCSIVESIKTTEGEKNYLEIGDIDIFNKTYNLSGKDKKTVKGAIKVPRGTLLISKVRPTRGAVVVTKSEINVSTGFSRLNIPNKFFYYIASQKKFLNYLGASAKGSTYPTCKDEDVLGFEILYPINPLEQKKIAEILEAVDSEIEKTDEIIAATEKLKKVLMQKFFGKKWSKRPFKDCVILFPKIKGLKITEYQSVGKYPIFDQSQDYISGYTDKKELLNYKTPAILFGDHTRILKYITTPFVAGADGTKIFQAKKDFNPLFLFYALLNLKIPNTGYNRHFKYLNSSSIPIPRIGEQKEIVQILSSVGEKIEINKKLKEKFILLKKGLMRDLLSGKVRVMV